MRFVVTGYRGWVSADAVFRTLDEVIRRSPDSDNFMGVGDCPTGGDLFAIEWSVDRKVPHEIFRANWSELGKRAGMVRNEHMINMVRPELVVAFLDPKSRGTLHARRYARSLEIPVFEVWQGQ
jgi:hypothetical protein